MLGMTKPLKPIDVLKIVNYILSLFVISTVYTGIVLAFYPLSTLGKKISGDPNGAAYGLIFFGLFILIYLILTYRKTSWVECMVSIIAACGITTLYLLYA